MLHGNQQVLGKEFFFLSCPGLGDRPWLDLQSGVWDVGHEGGRLKLAMKGPAGYSVVLYEPAL